MQIKKIIFEETYKHFEIGELVKPGSRRCVLEPGIYKITRMCPPLYAGDVAVCFVEGREHGVSTEYLIPANESDNVQ